MQDGFLSIAAERKGFWCCQVMMSSDGHCAVSVCQLAVATTMGKISAGNSVLVKLREW